MSRNTNVQIPSVPGRSLAGSRSSTGADTIMSGSAETSRKPRRRLRRKRPIDVLQHEIAVNREKPEQPGSEHDPEIPEPRHHERPFGHERHDDQRYEHCANDNARPASPGREDGLFLVEHGVKTEPGHLDRRNHVGRVEDVPRHRVNHLDDSRLDLTDHLRAGGPHRRAEREQPAGQQSARQLHEAQHAILAVLVAQQRGEKAGPHHVKQSEGCRADHADADVVVFAVIVGHELFRRHRHHIGRRNVVPHDAPENRERDHEQRTAPCQRLFHSAHCSRLHRRSP